MSKLEKTLEFKNICMYFSGVKALENISFKASGGETLALVGENGAGKSTLLKILSGDYQASSGSYLIDGRERRFASPREAIDAGVGMISQERQMVPELTVAENIFIGNFPERLGLVDFGKMNREAETLIAEFGLDISPREKVKNLSVAMQQMVEIIKIYSRDPKLIAFDEPTTALTNTETEKLFHVIEHKLKKKDIIIIYVSHRMNEVFQLADKIVTLKDGELVAVEKSSETTEERVISQMVGRPLEKTFAELERVPPREEEILRVNGLSGMGYADISFSLKKGEILGFFGLVGAGRTELMRGVFGADRPDGGYIEFEGSRLRFKSPGQAVSHGIGFLTEDRKEQGIIPIGSVRDNMSVVVLDSLKKGPFLDSSKENSFTKENVQRYDIKTPSIFKKISELSGGNQQKVLIARWLSMGPRILILDEPTKGVDVGAKAEIYKLIRSMANSGISVILISSELPEVIGLSDRIEVMKNGRLVGEVPGQDATEEVLIRLAMAGGNKEELN